MHHSANKAVVFSTHLLRASLCINFFTAFWLVSSREWRLACNRLADLVGALPGAPFRLPFVAGELIMLKSVPLLALLLACWMRRLVLELRALPVRNVFVRCKIF